MTRECLIPLGKNNYFVSRKEEHAKYDAVFKTLIDFPSKNQRDFYMDSLYE